MKRLTILRIACDPVARICSAVAPVILPANTVEATAEKYLGGGKLVDIPDLELTQNGDSQRIDITVSGVSAKTIATFRNESHTLKGSLAQVGYAWQDDDWQIVQVEWLAVLVVGAATISSQGSQGGRSRSISISLGSDFVDRNNAPLSLWTDADQRRRSPDDAFFDHMAGITTGLSRQFGPSDAS
jgi:hypothetical protein